MSLGQLANPYLAAQVAQLLWQESDFFVRETLTWVLTRTPRPAAEAATPVGGDVQRRDLSMHGDVATSPSSTDRSPTAAWRSVDQDATAVRLCSEPRPSIMSCSRVGTVPERIGGGSMMRVTYLSPRASVSFEGFPGHARGRGSLPAWLSISLSGRAAVDGSMRGATGHPVPEQRQASRRLR